MRRMSRCHWLPVKFDADSNRSYDYLVVVTFDPAKDAKNIREHGISLQLAEDVDFDAALTFTEVEDGIIRAISLRKASQAEGKRYEQA